MILLWLGGSIYTKDIERLKSSRSNWFRYGIYQPTNCITARPTIWGTKRSGYGRELAEQGIHEFVKKKLIRVSIDFI
jgi:succinate-semialdehyde dehydrogenase/glutarate-semialdehyde dehydrogenase